MPPEIVNTKVFRAVINDHVHNLRKTKHPDYVTGYLMEMVCQIGMKLTPEQREEWIGFLLQSDRESK